jgi:hypothetical protein
VHFEESIDVDARQQRLWDVLSDVEAWPQRIETVDLVELLTAGRTPGPTAAVGA